MPAQILELKVCFIGTAVGGDMLRYLSGLSLFVATVISVLLGCVECRAQSETTEISSRLILPAGTPVILRIKKSLYKKDAKPGQPVEFEVAYDVFVNGQVVIQSGTNVNGSVQQVDHAGKGPPKVLIDLGRVQTVSGEMVRLASSSFLSNRSGGIEEAFGWGSAAPPILPGLVIASLFEKKVLLDKDAWGGVWAVTHAAENVTLDPAKQKAAQEQYTANREAAQAELCELLASPAPNWERFGSLARQTELADSNKAILLRSAGDLDGAIEVYQKLLASKQDLPCSDKYSMISSDVPWSIALALARPEMREQLQKSISAVRHLELAGLYREKRDFVHAISECRTALQVDPEDERIRIGLISTLQDSGDLDAAIAESKEAIRIWPDKAYFHYLLGRALSRKNDPDAAIAELQWALKKEKNHFSPANCELGRAFEAKGDLPAAMRQYRTAFRAHVNDEQCRAAYERLQLQLKK
jgi:tetratricopeptide (TPR) repeat protein